MKHETVGTAPDSRALTAKFGRGLDRLGRWMGTPVAQWIVLSAFVLQASVLAFIMHIGMPPDEVNQTEFINFYAHHSLSPIFTNQTPTYFLGDKTREVDYLYHYIMSFVVRLVPLPVHYQYVLIRLFSVLFALLTFLILIKIAKLLNISSAVSTTAILILSNLPMVLMISSAVNNDVLVWLGLSLGILLLLRLWQRPTAINLAWLFALAFLGGLVKRDLLPVGVIFGLIGLYILARHYRTIIGDVRRFNWQLCLALLVLVIGVGLFSERVGGNVIHYKSIVVSCDKVHGQTACYDFWANVRSRTLATMPPESPVNPVSFAVQWTGRSFANVIDIQTQFWRHAVKPARPLTPLLVAGLAGGICYGLYYEGQRFRHDGISRRRLSVMAIAVLYIGSQLAVNYGTYRSTKIFGLALNGRYLIPSILLLVILSCFYWGKLLQRRPRLLVTLCIVLVVCTIAFSGLELMLRNSQLYTGLVY